MDHHSQPLRGRVWKGGKIIFGRLDNSVSFERLVEKDHGLTLSDGFVQAIGKEITIPLRILDIEEKK